MNAIGNSTKNALGGAIQFLNQPLVKEGVKKVLGTITFVFGIAEMYDLYQISQGRSITTETYENCPKWVEVSSKVAIICAKVSLILSAGVSKPGVFIISNLVGVVFSSSQLETVFGPNTIFAVNPWHPRHVVSIAAAILALPSLAQMVYRGFQWISTTESPEGEATKKPRVTKETTFWTDTKVRFTNLFNLLTGRPTLHVGNQFAHYLFRVV